MLSQFKPGFMLSKKQRAALQNRESVQCTISQKSEVTNLDNGDWKLCLSHKIVAGVDQEQMLKKFVSTDGRNTQARCYR